MLLSTNQRVHLDVAPVFRQIVRTSSCDFRPAEESHGRCHRSTTSSCSSPVFTLLCVSFVNHYLINCSYILYIYTIYTYDVKNTYYRFNILSWNVFIYHSHGVMCIQETWSHRFKIERYTVLVVNMFFSLGLQGVTLQADVDLIGWDQGFVPQWTWSF